MRAIVHGRRPRGTVPPPSELPAWITAGVNEWATISGTTAPSNLIDYSGVALRDDGSTTEILAALSGGHNGNVTDNSVKVIDLTVASPSWATVKANSDFTGYDNNTMTHLPSDGSPGPRHLYNAVTWWENRGDYIFGGRFYAFDGSDDGVGIYNKIDGFNRSDNTWRASGYYGPRAETVCPFSVVDPATGIIYATEGKENTPITGFKMDPTTLAITTWHGTSGAQCTRGPNAWDTARGKCFQLGHQNYDEGFSSTMVSLTIAPNGTKTAISFNASAAYTAWAADLANYLSPAMVYDPTADCFYWYNGDDGRAAGGRSNRVYKITPNGTSTWDMSFIDGAGVTPPATRSALGSFDGTKYTSGNFNGTNTQLGFVDRWGVLLLVRAGQNVHYMKVR